MPRTWKRLAGPVVVQNAATTVYTVPASTKAIIRHVHVSNPTGASVDFTLSIGADAAGTRLFDGYAIAAGAVLDWYPIAVMLATEILQALASTDEELVITVFGEEETL